jgi:RNA ligase
MFETITHLADFAPHIEGPGSTTIIRARRNGLLIFDYAVSAPDTFINNYRRECRGIVFDEETGELVSRPFNKFFNIGEKPETLVSVLDFTRPHHVLDKLDGSMIHAFVRNGEITMFTRMGQSDPAMAAKAMLDDLPGHRGLIHEAYEDGWTPIFEFQSPLYRIVLRHRVPKLEITALRHRESGVYMDYDKTVDFCGRFGVGVASVAPPVKDVASFIEGVRGMTDCEGYVVRFADGLHVKIKTDWYVGLHRVKFDVISHEPTLLSFILNGKIDDIKAQLDEEEDREEVSRLEREFWSSVERKVMWLQERYDVLAAHFEGNNERFAKEAMPTISDKVLVRFLFEMLKGKSAFEIIHAYVRRNVITDEERGSLVGSVTWDRFKKDFLEG